MTNNYNPVWWDSDLTIYNKYTDPTTNVVRWYRTNLSNCFWKHERAKLSVGNTVLETDTVICRIPEDDRFKPKYEWLKIPNDEMSDYFTLGIEDIIINGYVSDDIDEYERGSRSTEIINKYKDLGVMQIDNVTINTGTGLLFNRHYLVKGQ